MIPLTAPKKTSSRLREKTVFGVGTNDANYPVRYTDPATKQKLKCPYYTIWTGMLGRVYDSNHSRTDNYKACSVHPSWLKFSVLRDWLIDNGLEKGLHLDKDLLVPGNKIYGPDTCCLVSSQVNSMVARPISNKIKDMPKGVSYIDLSKRTKPYRVTLTNVLTNKIKAKHFISLHKALQYYYQAKSDQLIDLASLQTNPKVAQGLLTHALLIAEGKIQ